MNVPNLLVAPLFAAALSLAPAPHLAYAGPEHGSPPQDFIDACQDDALRLCHDEAMSQDDARISKCMKAHKQLVSARCLALARKYKKI
jgi:hypothetical protein